MNGKHYLGKRVRSFELYDTIGPISGVAMLVDDNTEVFAGDESGYVLEIECPYATQEMAEAALQKAASGSYKGFRATGAGLGIDAELGDGVTVNGIYSVLAYQKLNFGPGHKSEISAPGENRVNHEFPYLSPERREAKRSRKAMWSDIEKNAETIALEVGKITTELENYATIEMTDASIEHAVSQSKIYTDGQVSTLGTTVTQSIEGVTTKINGVDGRVTTVEKTIDGLTVTDDSGTTKISGSSIETDTLYVKSANITGDLVASSLKGREVNITDTSGSLIGYFSTVGTSEGASLSLLGANRLYCIALSGNAVLMGGSGASITCGGSASNPVVTVEGTFYAANYEERIYALERMLGLA